MSADVKLLEKPIKYAFIAMIVFVMSAFILGNAYEILALSSLGLPLSATWDSVEAISGLSMDRSVRYFVFYFIGFLMFACYEKSIFKSSSWNMLVLFAAFPAAMSVAPYFFSGGFEISSYWAKATVLLSLLYLGVGHAHPSKTLRNFFFLLMAYIGLVSILQEAALWEKAIHAQAENLFNDAGLVDKRVNATFVWFAPAALASVGVKLYLLYWLPQKFFGEMNRGEAAKND